MVVPNYSTMGTVLSLDRHLLLFSSSILGSPCISNYLSEPRDRYGEGGTESVDHHYSRGDSSVPNYKQLSFGRGMRERVLSLLPPPPPMQHPTILGGLIN